MSFNTSATLSHLTRANLWSAQLKDILLDELEAQRWMNWLSEFPDGTTFNIPSVGQASVQDIVEDTPVSYEAMDTGNFSLIVDEYTGSAHYITRKAQQDSFYSSFLINSFVEKERRAMMEKLETDILKAPGPNASQGGQTIDVTGAINGHKHRYGASGTSGLMALADVAYAKLALKKANVPMSNLVAIVDPSVGFTFETLTNIVNVSNNPQWDGLVGSGITTGMRFIKNVYGFDVYESNYVDTPTDATCVDYAGNDVQAACITSSAKQNIFFSAAGGDINPIIGAMRQMPTVDSEFNKDLQREEYITTMRYGLKLYRPENMVCVLSDGAVS